MSALAPLQMIAFGMLLFGFAVHLFSYITDRAVLNLGAVFIIVISGIVLVTLSVVRWIL